MAIPMTFRTLSRPAVPFLPFFLGGGLRFPYYVTNPPKRVTLIMFLRIILTIMVIIIWLLGYLQAYQGAREFDALNTFAKGLERKPIHQ